MPRRAAAFRARPARFARNNGVSPNCFLNSASSIAAKAARSGVTSSARGANAVSVTAEPLWARSGRALLYGITEGIVTAQVSASASFAIESRPVDKLDYYETSVTHGTGTSRPMATSSCSVGEPALMTGVIVHNWGREQRAMLAAAKRQTRSFTLKLVQPNRSPCAARRANTSKGSTSMPRSRSTSLPPYTT